MNKDKPKKLICIESGGGVAVLTTAMNFLTVGSFEA